MSFLIGMVAGAILLFVVESVLDRQYKGKKKYYVHTYYDDAC